MKKYIILISSIILSVSLSAQNPFNFTEGTSSADYGDGLCLINNDTILMTINSEGYFPANIGHKCLFLSNSGDTLFSVLNESSYAKDYINVYQNVVASTGRYINSQSISQLSLNIFNYKTKTNILKTYGGDKSTIGLDLVCLPDSGFLIAGIKVINQNDYDIYLIRTDKNGDSIWTKTYGDAYLQTASSIEKQNDSIYIISGTLGSSTQVSSYIMKINLNGDSLILVDQNLSYRTVNMLYDNSNYVLSGVNESESNSPSMLLKVDSSLNLIWEKNYKAYSTAFDVEKTFDGGYIFVGSCAVPIGDFDTYIVKTNSNGDTIWTKIIGGDFYDEAYKVIQAPDSSYIITGKTESYGMGNSDAFLLKLKPNGDLTTSIGLEISPKYLEAKVFPNPTSEEFNLKIDNYSGELQMQIIDISGKSIYKENLNIDFNYQKSFKLKNLSSGVYNISLKGDDFEKALKLVVE